MSVRVQFKCWKCKNVLKEFPGDAHNVREQVKCATCGALNVLDYAFPLAVAEIVGEPDPPPADAPAVPYEEGMPVVEGESAPDIVGDAVGKKRGVRARRETGA